MDVRFKSMFSRKILSVIIICLVISFIFGIAGCSKPTTGQESKTESTSLQSETADQESSIDASEYSEVSDQSDASDTSDTSEGIQSQTNQSSSSAGGGITSKPGAVVTPGATGFVKPKFDLKGKEIVIWGATQPRNGTIEYASWKEVEKEYNCTLKFVKVTYSVAVAKQTAAALSGTSECDIWFTQWYDVFPSFIAKGMVSPLSDHYDFDKDPVWNTDTGNNSNYWNGKLYGLNSGVSGPSWGLWYNKSMITKENLEDPAALAKQGKWNWDKFLEMCIKLTKDTDSDGQTDQWGYYDEYLFVNMILTNGGEVIDIDHSDGPKFTMNSAPTNYAIRYALDLANKYGVVPSIGSIGDPVLLEMFPKGKVAFTTYAPGYGPLCISKGMKASDLGYTYFPKGPDAKDFILHAPTMSAVYIVPPQVKDRDAVTCVLQDYIAVWDSSEEFAVDRTDLLDIVFSSSEYNTIYDNNKDFMLNGGKKNKPSYINNFFIGELLNTDLLYPLLKSEIDVESGIRSITPKVQTRIDEMVMQTLG